MQKGEVVIRAFSRGELRAVRAQTLLAPNLNGTIQVTQLAPVGSLAKEKDLIIEYDDSERQAALEESAPGTESYAAEGVGGAQLASWTDDRLAATTAVVRAREG